MVPVRASKDHSIESLGAVFRDGNDALSTARQAAMFAAVQLLRETASMDITLSADEIRVRAYLLWEAQGCQDGRDAHYWHEAIAQLRRERAGAPGSTGIGPVATPVATPDASQPKARKSVAAKKVGQEAPAKVGKNNSATNGKQKTAKTPKVAAERQAKTDTKSEAKSDSKADAKVKAQAKAGAKSKTQQKADATARAGKLSKNRSAKQLSENSGRDS
ncbi:DUF2934 domain-containing protein [Caballeronia sp. S22]|uniref:DUF2934 domain-containing protein n=1 Tax=Caballeronia sp. S22 TaxID=3137182 RepID=UPI003530DDCF